MGRTRWQVVGPILLLGIGLFAAAIIRGVTNSNFGAKSWLYITLPIVAIGLSILGVLAWLRLSKSRRLWETMLTARPSKDRFLVMLHPDSKRELEKLGWRLRGTAYASTPVIGLILDDEEITFWEGDFPDYTFAIPNSAVDGARLADVPDMVRQRHGIVLKIRSGTRSRDLHLDLRTAGHKSLKEQSRKDAVRLVKVESKSSGGTVS